MGQGSLAVSAGFIHPKAHVECAIIGEHVTIWQFATVIRGAFIGDGTKIGAGASIDAANVGADCSIGASVFIPPGVSIGSRCFIGPGAIFCNDAWPRVSREGYDFGRLLDGYSTVIRVNDDVSIGAGAIILPGVTIGAGSIIAAGVTVEHPVPEGVILRRDGRLDPLRGWPVKRIIEAAC